MFLFARASHLGYLFLTHSHFKEGSLGGMNPNRGCQQFAYSHFVGDVNVLCLGI